MSNQSNTSTSEKIEDRLSPANQEQQINSEVTKINISDAVVGPPVPASIKFSKPQASSSSNQGSSKEKDEDSDDEGHDEHMSEEDEDDDVS